MLYLLKDIENIFIFKRVCCQQKRKEKRKEKRKFKKLPFHKPARLKHINRVNI